MMFLENVLFNANGLCLSIVFIYLYIRAMKKFLTRIKFAPLNVPLERRLQTLSVAIWIVTLVGGGFLGALLFAYILFFTRFWSLAILYGVWIYIDKDICETGSRRIEWVRRWPFWDYFCKYFPLHLIKTVDLDPTKNYLFCVFPHGLICIGSFGHFATESTGFSEKFKGLRPCPTTLRSHFNMPFFREYVLSFGSCTASAQSIEYLLRRPEGGNAVILFVGGAAESFHCRPGTYRIILKRRKGFIRVALTNGSPLVPVFSFGETDLFDQVNNPEGSLLRRAQEFVKKVTGIAPIIPIGRGFFQYTFGILPNRKPVYTVVGEPLEVEKIEDPTEEDVERLHSKFTEKLIELFETHKHKYLKNPEKTELIIE